MELAASLKTGIEAQAEGLGQQRMLCLAQALSRRYQSERGTGARLVTTDEEAAVYAVVRMPATFGAVTAALEAALQCTPLRPRTLLDVGAGTGAAAWGAAALLPLKRVCCIEREDAMLRLGRRLMQEGTQPVLQAAQWLQADISAAVPGHTAELVIACYVLNELTEANRLEALDRLWDATTGMLLLVEPGTPEGARQVGLARRHLLAKGAHIAAPCPHTAPCPLSGDDWCHFSCRVARSRLHKQLKGGDAPYEDEKFSYIAFTRTPAAPTAARILRHPRIEKGRITLQLCGRGGITAETVTKRDAQAFRQARKAAWGDGFPAGNGVEAP